MRTRMSLCSWNSTQKSGMVTHTLHILIVGRAAAVSLPEVVFVWMCSSCTVWGWFIFNLRSILCLLQVLLRYVESKEELAVCAANKKPYIFLIVSNLFSSPTVHIICWARACCAFTALKVRFEMEECVFFFFFFLIEGNCTLAHMGYDEMQRELKRSADENWEKIKPAHQERE